MHKFERHDKGRDRQFEKEIVDFTGNKHLKEMFDALDIGLCPFCKKEINFEDFRDVESINEYGISGLCQACMDEFFSKNIQNF